MVLVVCMAAVINQRGDVECLGAREVHQKKDREEGMKMVVMVVLYDRRLAGSKGG